MKKRLKLKKCNQKYFAERIKTLSNIKEYLHEKNEYWWGKERTDLDLKYYVPTDIICEALSNCEIGIPKHIQAYINKQNYRKYWQGYDIYNYMEMLCKKGKVEYIGADNSYNYTGKVQNDFDWHSFKMLDKENRYIVLLSFHIGGDIRGNYTDFIVLEFDYKVGFEELLCDLSYEYNLTFDLKVENKIYAITPLVLNECLEVYDYETDENICGIWGSDDESVIEQIFEKIKNEVVKYMLDNDIIIMAEYDNFLNIEIYDIDHWKILLNDTIDFIDNKDKTISNNEKNNLKQYIKMILNKLEGK